MNPNTPSDGNGRQTDKNLDEALQETFPASDPIAFTPRRAGKNDHKVIEDRTSRLKDWWQDMMTRVTNRPHH
jgi:hypothetical protein